jgi:hypothetical protein
MYVERQPWATPRPLGRHVNHDPRSRRFAFRAPRRVDIRSVRHERHVPVFDQGDTGSCTGNAAVGALATGQYRRTVTDADASWLQPLDQSAARECYSRATRIDPFRGEWPPEDTGSDGLSVAKVLHEAGAISGYRHAFAFDDALAALMDGPVITGTNWYPSMFDPAPDGLVTIRPGDRPDGGHEYIVDEYDADKGWLGFTNSWGSGWGVGGRFFMTRATFQRLLMERGDVTVFVPSTEPVPEPAPAPGDAADIALLEAVASWADRDAVCGRKARRAIRAWREAKGL